MVRAQANRSGMYCLLKRSKCWAVAATISTTMRFSNRTLTNCDSLASSSSSSSSSSLSENATTTPLEPLTRFQLGMFLVRITGACSLRANLSGAVFAIAFRMSCLSFSLVGLQSQWSMLSNTLSSPDNSASRFEFSSSTSALRQYSLVGAKLFLSDGRLLLLS